MLLVTGQNGARVGQGKEKGDDTGQVCLFARLQVDLRLLVHI